MHPGPIDNGALLKGTQEVYGCLLKVKSFSLIIDAKKDILEDQLIEGLDYVLLPESVWSKVLNWYWLKPGSRPIRRYVYAQAVIIMKSWHAT